MLTNEQDALMQKMVDALATALNLEGPAVHASRYLITWDGLDVPAHFIKIREALTAAQEAGWDRS